MRINKILIVLLFLFIFFLFYYFYFWWYSYFYFPAPENPEVLLKIEENDNYSSFDFEILEISEDKERVFLFLPKNKNLDSSPVILFFHGLKIGERLELLQTPGLIHLAKRGNILIVPFYEKNLTSLFSSKKLIGKAEKLAKLGISKIKEIAPKNDFSKFAILGVSLGGAVATNISFENFPEPSTLILITPAETFPLVPPKIFGVPFGNLQKISAKTHLLGILAEKDRIVKANVVKEIFIRAPVKEKHLFLISSDNYGNPPLISNHNNLFSANDFLNVNAVFKLIDATLDCSFENKDCQIIKNQNLFLGYWNDGKEIRRSIKIELK